jgi:hypothetical protein
MKRLRTTIAEVIEFFRIVAIIAFAVFVSACAFVIPLAAVGFAVAIPVAAAVWTFRLFLGHG